LCNGKSRSRNGYMRWVCYAKRVAWPTAREKWQYTYDASLRSGFVAAAVDELYAFDPLAVRLHAAGDFYSAAYVRQWIEIVDATPHIKFWAYTRSWRVPRMWRSLADMASLPNFQLFLSTDAETAEIDGKPAHMKYAMISHMKHHQDEPLPRYVDLVWKDKSGRAKPTPRTFACPQGRRTTKLHAAPNCQKCRWCFSSCTTASPLYTLEDVA